jgi:NhaP-type Na+/H+ or K+/H+ antiporter
VFAGVPQSETLFTITSVVVVASIVFHGAMLVLILPRQPTPAPVIPQQVERTAPAPSLGSAPVAATSVPEDGAEVRVTLDEIRAREARGDRVVIVDARADGAWRAAATKARGAARVDPAAPAYSAAQLALPRHDWLVAYCA